MNFTNLKSRFSLFFFLMLALESTLFCAQAELTEYESAFISHVENSILKAQNEISNLPEEVLSIRGMSNSKVRHLLNNLCSMPNTSYLEIGCFMGSTFIASLYNNQSTIISAIGIDNWSEFDGPRDVFEKNCSEFLSSSPYLFYNANCFTLNVKATFTLPITVYFYDGGHTYVDQELAFTYYDPALNDVFVAVVDDWNFPQVEPATRQAITKLGYEVLFEKILPARYNGDMEQWWNGLFVAVFRKPKA
jgi:hypothetical protein